MSVATQRKLLVGCRIQIAEMREVIQQLKHTDYVTIHRTTDEGLITLHCSLMQTMHWL